MRKSFDRHWYAWAMVLPTVIVLGVLVFYPLVRGVWQSFTDLNESNQRDEICTKILGGGDHVQAQPRRGEFVGLDNYVDILTGAAGRLLAAVRQHPRVDRRLRRSSTTASAWAWP